MARTVDLGKGSRFIVLASVCIVVAGLYFAQEVFIPLALAVLISFVLAPLASRLERLRVPRAPSVLIVVLLALSLVGFLSYSLVSQFFDVATNLPNYRGEINKKIDHFRGGGKLTTTLQNIQNTVTAAPATQPTSGPTSGPTTNPAESLETALASPGESLAAKTPPGAPTLPNVTPDNPLPVRVFEATSPVKTTIEYLGGALHPLATAFLVIVFVIFMLLRREDLRDRMIRLVSSGRLNLTTTAVADATDRISSYLFSLAIVNLCYGGCVAGGLWIIGKLLGHGHPFPNALLWGLLCGVSRFIPYVGVWVGAALPVALSFGLFPGYGVFFATAGMYATYELLVSQFVEPLLYGARTGMSTIAVLASAVFWAWLWGPVGLLLSTPLTVILVVIGKHVPQLQFLDILLGDEPVLEPPVRIYQRLLALDAEESAELARNYLKENSLEYVYEEVLLPALALAEHDRHRGRLDEQRQTFLLQTIRDLIEELGDLHSEEKDKAAKAEEQAAVAPASNDAGAPSSAAASQAPPEKVGRWSVPGGCKVNVLCLPAHDESDEIAGLMLARLLQDRAYCASAMSHNALASEMLENVESKDAHIVVVSALPPAAVAHARYLCKRLHLRFPEIKMVVGLWTAKGDLTAAKDRITCGGNVQLVTKFADTMEQIQQLTHPVLITAGKNN